MSRDHSDFINPWVRDLPPSGIREFFDLVSQMSDVISLGVGEPDFRTPWHICDEVYDSLRQGNTSYTSNLGLPELRQGIAAKLEELYGVKYRPEDQIIATTGVSEAIDLAVRMLVRPGDEVLIPEPCFVAYPACVSLTGGAPVLVPTSEEDAFKVRAERLEEHVTDRTRALLMGFPNNPTGAVMTAAELQPVAEFAQRHDLLVLSDETYDRLTYNGKHACFAGLPEMQERTLLLNGFSKSYAMTGWRIGYACGPADLIEAMNRIHAYTMMCAPNMAQVAGVEALKNGEDAVEKMREAYNERRRFLVKGLRDLGLSCFEPLGAFYVFPNIQSTGLTSREFAQRLVQEQGVAVVPGPAFGPSGEGYVRATYATSIQKLQEALERIGKFLESL